MLRLLKLEPEGVGDTLAGYIPDEKIAELRERINIVDIISDYVSLKKVGKNYKGLCPFHSEKTPSFTVNEEKQIFHCFGCNSGGNVFNFVMKMDHLSFPEVVRELAKRYGVDLPKIKMFDADQGETLKREKLFNLNKLALSYYHNLLVNEEEGREARGYLKNRGIGDEVIIDHRLGYARNSWDGLLNFLSKRKVLLSLAEEVGLIIQKKGRGFYDRFRGRIIFPIINPHGKVIGFGGRVLDDTLPKYLNSPESPIYNKSNSLYGLNVAKDFIRSEDKVVIVEGYFDLLSLNQYGIKNVVATLGTALTQSHIKALKRYTKNMITIFDADEAGEKAVIRSFDVFLKDHISPKIAALPSGFDPDSLVKKVGGEGFREIIAGSIPLIEFVISETIKKHDTSSAEGKKNIIEEIVPVLAKIENRVERGLYIQEVSNRLGVKEETILLQFRRTGREKIDLRREDIHFMDEDLAERILLQLMLLKDEVMHKIQGGAIIEEFTNKRYREIGLLFLDVFNREGWVDSIKVINLLEDEDSRSLVSQLLLEEESIVDSQKTLENCIYKVRMNRMKEEKKMLDLKIKEAQERKDETHLREFMISRQELMKKEKDYRQAFLNPNA